jgi:hypothetical protein
MLSQNLEVLIELLKADAEVKAKNSAGRTAFDCAQGKEKLRHIFDTLKNDVIAP